MTEIMAAQAVQKASAINVHVYRNGDPYFGPKHVVVNPRKVREFDSFLNEVTRLVRLSGGAVRNIYTPTQGHRVQDVADLVNNCFYVAGGKEKFKRDQYNSGWVRNMNRPRQRLQRQIRPVAHNNRIQVSARCRKTQEGPKIVHVFRNRDDKSAPVKLLLDKRHRATMDTVCDYVNLKVNLISGQAVQRLYHLTGAQVLDESEIETGGQYVAAAREKFAKVGYGNTEVNSPRGGKTRFMVGRVSSSIVGRVPSNKIFGRSFMFGRVPSNTAYGLRPVVQLPRVKAAAVKSSPRPPQARRLPPGKAKPTPKPPARRPPVQKKRPAEKAPTPKKEAEGYIPMKPAMVKRSREKEEKVSPLGDKPSSPSDDKSSLDYSDDPNSVFKAKEKRDEDQGANEVQDSNDTKTELPIDQVAAEEVEEEDNLKEEIAPDDSDNKDTNPPPKSPEPEVVEELPEPEPEPVPEEQEDPIMNLQEDLTTNQNNNHQQAISPENHLETSDDPPPVVDDEDIKPASPPATPDQKSPSPAPSPVPSPPQDRPESSQSPAFMTDDKPKSTSPNLDLPKSPSPESSKTPSPESTSPKPLSPSKDKTPSPEPASPLQPKPPSPKEAASPDNQQEDKPASPQQVESPAGSRKDSNEESDKPNSIDDDEITEDIPREDSRDDIPKENDDEIAEDIPQNNNEDENQPQSPVDNNNSLNPDESNSDADKPADDDQPADNSADDDQPSQDKVRTPSPPKSARKTPSRTRSVTPSRQSPAPAPKEQIGNGHAPHTEEVNA